ncbi:MAG TPA: PAS domain-containing protein, partial [Stellaceae bacterium]
ADLDRALWRGFGLIALAALLVVITVLAIGRRIIRRPTALLLDGVGRWAAGDLDARVPVGGDRRSEFGRLGAAFNAMADALQERDRRLREAEERALTRERDFSRLVIENSADAIVSYDRHFRVLSWNPAMERFSGLPAPDAVGRPFLDVLPSFRDTPLQRAMQDAAAGRTATTRDCTYELHETGRKGVCEAEHAPLRDPEGTILGGIAFIRDITERRHLEASLVQAQKIEAVGQLTSGVAHDFNNLLAACLGNLELLRPKLADPAQIKLADGAARAAARGAKLTEQLLAFSRRQHRDPRPVDLNAIVAGMEDMLCRSLGPAIRIEKALAAGLWPVLADANQIELAVLNLALNGRDAMPVGGTLLIETANLPEGHPRLPRELSGCGGFVLIAVSDNGSGMPDDVAARAFEPFFTTKGPGRGSGLGLSMVYGTAKQAGGIVEIRTRPGEGTTVSIFLPRTATAAPAMPHAGPDVAPSLGASAAIGRILLVDDDRDVREFAAVTLRQFGHGVIERETGWAAVELVAAGEPIDLLVVDFAMPSISGAEVARRVRAIRPDLPILLVTGYAEADAGELPPGIVMLKKPFRIAELADAVGRALAPMRPPQPAPSANVLPLRPAGGGGKPSS